VNIHTDCIYTLHIQCMYTRNIQPHSVYIYIQCIYTLPHSVYIYTACECTFRAVHSIYSHIECMYTFNVYIHCHIQWIYTLHVQPHSESARPYESCKIFKGRPRRNAFSKLVHRQYKSFPPDRFCQVEIKKTTGLSNKHGTA